MENDQAPAEQFTHTVPDLAEPIRADRYLASLDQHGLSRTKIKKLIDSGDITVNGERIASKQALSGGEIVEINILHEKPHDLIAENIPLDIIYQDEWLVVVNKAAGMVTHPAVGNHSGTLVNALLYHFESLATSGGGDRPGIVHRLDKNTSGLLVVARREDAFAALQEMIQAREVHRNYSALIWGHVKEEKGTIDAPIGRSRRDRTRMAVATDGREAVTGYEVLERFRAFDLVECTLHTGRTHQIRVHFAHAGHPVFGDPEYGGRETRLPGMFAPERPLAKTLLEKLDHQALHSCRLSFVHPHSNKSMTFEAPLPPDFASVLAHLREHGH